MAQYYIIMIKLTFFNSTLGHELKDSIIVAYLLEYYSRYATDDAGWMCTVSEALPLLYKYNYGLFHLTFSYHIFEMNL
jgi:hypothetical protein